MPIGDGGGTLEPGGLLVNKVINNDFLGAFRSNIAKILVIVTDAGPGGEDQIQNATDTALFNTLATQCQNAGIKVIVLGSGSSNSLYRGLNLSILLGLSKSSGISPCLPREFSGM